MMSLMTAGFGQMLSSYTSPLIDKFLPEIQSPILDNVLRNGLDNSISGFALGTLFSFNEEGQTLGGALQEGILFLKATIYKWIDSKGMVKWSKL